MRFIAGRCGALFARTNADWRSISRPAIPRHAVTSPRVPLATTVGHVGGVGVGRVVICVVGGCGLVGCDVVVGPIDIANFTKESLTEAAVSQQTQLPIVQPQDATWGYLELPGATAGTTRYYDNV